MDRKPGYFEEPAARRKLKRIFLLALAVSVVADFFVAREQVHFPWERVPGFYALFGLAACVLIIVLAKTIGYAWLMKKENYYE